MVKLLRVNYKHIRFGGAGVKARVGVLGRGVDRETALEWNPSSRVFRKGTVQKP